MKYEFRFDDDSIKVTQNINYKFYIKNSIKVIQLLNLGSY